MLTFGYKPRVLLHLLLIISELILKVCIRKVLLLLLLLLALALMLRKLGFVEFLDNLCTSVQVLLYSYLKLSSTLQALPNDLVLVQRYFRVLPILVRMLRFQVSLIKSELIIQMCK